MEFAPQYKAAQGYCPACEKPVSWTKTERRWQKIVTRPAGLRMASGIETSFVCEVCGYVTNTAPDSLEAQANPQALPAIPTQESTTIDPVPIPPPPPAKITEADLKSQMTEMDARIRKALQQDKNEERDYGEFGKYRGE